MTTIDMRGIETACLSDVGRQRSNNQDHYGSLVADSGARLLIVADGMGGHAGGATASHVAVEAIERVFETSEDEPELMLRSALEAANQAVHRRAHEDARLAGMGTTGVALLLEPDGRAWVANVGDSRAYRLREGRLEQLTLDHSLVAELVRRGMLTAEEAQVHPRRNEVLRSLGVEAEVSVDVTAVDVQAGDQYLLCSDGLSGVVDDQEIAAVLIAEAPADAVRRLVDAANERGGPDNVTVQIARIPDAAVAAAPEERREPQRARQGSLRGLLIALIVVIALLLLVLLWAFGGGGGGAGGGALGGSASTPEAARAP
jgi:protein phosphatase